MTVTPSRAVMGESVAFIGSQRGTLTRSVEASGSRGRAGHGSGGPTRPGHLHLEKTNREWTRMEGNTGFGESVKSLIERKIDKLEPISMKSMGMGIIRANSRPFAVSRIQM
jgi:hypothetical protein